MAPSLSPIMSNEESTIYRVFWNSLVFNNGLAEGKPGRRYLIRSIGGMVASLPEDILLARPDSPCLASKEVLPIIQVTAATEELIEEKDSPRRVTDEEDGFDSFADGAPTRRRGATVGEVVLPEHAKVNNAFANGLINTPEKLLLLLREAEDSAEEMHQVANIIVSVLSNDELLKFLSLLNEKGRYKIYAKALAGVLDETRLANLAVKLMVLDSKQHPNFKTFLRETSTLFGQILIEATSKYGGGFCRARFTDALSKLEEDAGSEYRGHANQSALINSDGVVDARQITASFYGRIALCLSRLLKELERIDNFPYLIHQVLFYGREILEKEKWYVDYLEMEYAKLPRDAKVELAEKNFTKGDLEGLDPDQFEEKVKALYFKQEKLSRLNGYFITRLIGVAIEQQANNIVHKNKNVAVLLNYVYRVLIPKYLQHTATGNDEAKLRGLPVPLQTFIKQNGHKFAAIVDKISRSSGVADEFCRSFEDTTVRRITYSMIVSDFQGIVKKYSQGGYAKGTRLEMGVALRGYDPERGDPITLEALSLIHDHVQHYKIVIKTKKEVEHDQFIPKKELEELSILEKRIGILTEDHKKSLSEEQKKAQAKIADDEHLKRLAKHQKRMEKRQAKAKKKAEKRAKKADKQAAKLERRQSQSGRSRRKSVAGRAWSTLRGRSHSNGDSEEDHPDLPFGPGSPAMWSTVKPSENTHETSVKLSPRG